MLDLKVSQGKNNPALKQVLWDNFSFISLQYHQFPSVYNIKFRLAHAKPSARPPIDTREHFCCRVTFKHLPQSIRILGQLLKIAKLSASFSLSFSPTWTELVLLSVIYQPPTQNLFKYDLKCKPKHPNKIYGT